jgi:pimeloyl-ACP methyl ester carboxylesterase
MPSTVLLLHAFPLGPELWEPQLEALAAYDVKTPAIAGRGDSIDGWAEQLLAENPGDIVLVGASMGGYCALAIAARVPERVKGLAFVGSRASADPPEGKGRRDRSIALLHVQGALALWRSMRDSAIGADADPAALERLEQIVAAQKVEDLVDELAAIRDRPDRTGVVRALRCPFLAIAGERDEEVAAESRKLVELAADGELVVVPGARHLVGFARPDAVNPVLLGFLGRCAG